MSELVSSYVKSLLSKNFKTKGKMPWERALYLPENFLTTKFLLKLNFDGCIKKKMKRNRKISL